MTEYQKRGYLLENFRLFHMRSQGETAVEFHYHEFCKVLFLIRGGGSYYIDGRRYAVRTGDIILVGSRSIHRPELEPGERIVLYIDPEYLRRESTETCDLRQLFSGGKGHVLRNHQRLFRLASALEQELGESGYGREILSSSTLLRLLVQIGRSMETATDPGAGANLPASPRIREIMAYMEAHLEEDLDAETIAAAFFISKYHMMRQFRRETGTTVHLYLTQRRLLKARALMDGGMRATEACYRCGFRSYSSFTRSCTKLLGTTPTGRMEGQRREEDYE